jgi:hypothetical protein
MRLSARAWSAQYGAVDGAETGSGRHGRLPADSRAKRCRTMSWWGDARKEKRGSGGEQRRAMAERGGGTFGSLGKSGGAAGHVPRHGG